MKKILSLMLAIMLLCSVTFATVTDQTQRVQYTATADQTVFAYTWRVLDDGDMDVFVDDVLTTAYSVSNVGTLAGGNITFNAGRTANEIIVILRNMPNTQETSYPAGGRLSTVNLELNLDRLTMFVQDVQESMGRSLKFPGTSTLSNIDYPVGTSATDRASKLAAWDTAGTSLELVTATSADSVSLIAVKGDILQGGDTGVAEKLGIGANGEIPYVVSGKLAYDKPWSVAWKKGVDIASANALTLVDDGNYFDITGTTAITSIVAADIGKVFRLHFDGALTLTHHATDLVIPSGSNITTIAGDEAVFIAYATGDVRLIGYYSSQPTMADFTQANHTHVSVVQGGALTGMAVQVVNVQDGAVASAAATIANDDSIPQNTEGLEVMTLAITPTNTNNKLKIEVVAHVASNNSPTSMCVALFQDSTANALAAARNAISATNDVSVTPFTHYMTAGTTSETTFKVRVGSAAGTVTFNGESAARKLGGVLASSITITEILVAP